MVYKHLVRLTDEKGIIQFSKGFEPDPMSGYTADDNARAFLVALNMKNRKGISLSKIYLNFLKEAQRRDGTYFNLRIGKRFYKDLDSEDSVGRVFLALSYGLLSEEEGIRRVSKALLFKTQPAVLKLKSPRAVSYVLIALCNLMTVEGSYRYYLRARDIAYYLVNLYNRNRFQNWYWFEEVLTYCNGVLPHSLFSFYMVSGDKSVRRVAEESLGFMVESLFKKGYLSVVGNKGWWRRGAKISLYDQQPVDAASTSLALLQAFLASGKRDYLKLSYLAYQWYWGVNINSVPLIDSATFGCYDAITPKGVNKNQGAEALISYLITKQALEEVMKKNRIKYCIPAV